MEGIPFLEGKYSPTLDLYPIQCEEFNRIYWFYDNLREGRFTTTKCKECGKVSFPPRVICPECYSDDLEVIDLPTKGKVITLVEKWGGVPIQYTPPMIGAWIGFPDDSPVKRYFSLLYECEKGEVQEGDEVELYVFDVAPHPIDKGRDSIMKERVFFGFTPVKK